ncbi:hypothetical protein EV359DRAFT_78560 [Lentinula novae-zelandiae]|nr:hypothetical protein EV359DRAFT_78560 [Lentinula novae-zelandiae]
MPPDWRQDVQTVPGTTSANAFMYLQTLWYQREEECKVEEQDTKRVKALMAVHTNNSYAANTNQPRVNGRQTITCHNCGKPGHIPKKCWGKGGGMEGQGPKHNNLNKTGTGTNTKATTSDDTDVT